MSSRQIESIEVLQSNTAVLDFTLGEKLAPLNQLFERQADLTPDAIAVSFGEATLTYGALNQQANGMARELRHRGVKTGSPVGVLMRRSHHTMVALMGVLKSGGVYVPLDAAYPAEHIRFIATDSGLEAMITTPETLPQVPEKWRDRCVVIGQESSTAVDTGNLDLQLDLDRPMLLIYTSGSTGRPKGVLHNEREQFVRFNWLWRAYPFKPDDVVGQRTSVGFIPSLWEFLGGLLAGVRTVIIPDHVIPDPPALAALVARERITRLAFVPYLLKTLLAGDGNLVRHMTHLRWVSIAGAPLPVTLYKRLRDWLPNTVILNEYGTTEANGISYFDTQELRLGDTQTVPIGRPIPGVTLYVLSELLEPIRIGEVGQLYVTQDSTGRHYVARPELNAEKFVLDPFVGAGTRMFATGDLVRVLPDGNIEYLGRTDNQLKIRDTRLEPEQVESVLSHHPAVKGAVVTPWRPDGETAKGLIAYLEAQGRRETLVSELRDLVSKQLPAHMVPSVWRFVERLPTTPNGKVDRNALVAKVSRRGVLPSREDALKDVAGFIVYSIQLALELEPEAVNPSARLADLGVDSLTTVELSILWEETLSVRVPIADILAQPTLQALSRHIANLVAGTKPDMVPASSLLQEWPFDQYLPSESVGAYDSTGDILLTGASGFFGAYLLRDLCKSTSCRIFCLVRCRDSAEGLERLRKNMRSYGLADTSMDILDQRVEVIPSDLGAERLGLSDADYANLAERISVILHAGASVHHLRSYADLHAVNVRGTAELVRLAWVGRLKRLAFVSSIAVAAVDKHGASLQSSGYAQTKWLAEKVIDRASQLGIPVLVVRCGNVSSPTNGGPGREDVVIRDSLRLFSQVGLLPTWPNAVVDVLPVDVVSHALVTLCRPQAQDFGGWWQFTHPRPAPLDSVIRCLSDIKELRQATYTQWLSACRTRLGESNILSQRALAAFFQQDIPLANEYFEPVGDALPALAPYLETQGIAIPDLHEDYLYQFVNGK